MTKSPMGYLAAKMTKAGSHIEHDHRRYPDSYDNNVLHPISFAYILKIATNSVTWMSAN